MDRCQATLREVSWPPREWPARIFIGSFPELAAHPRTMTARTTWFDSYVDAFVEKDLPGLGDVHSRMGFRKFWRVAASASAQLRDLCALGAALGLSYHTAGRYLSLLEQGCHLFRLEPYFASVGKRLTKSPKLFSEDTGLALFLSGIRTVEQFEASDRRGAWLENFAVAEVKSTVELFLPGAQLWFWRTLGGAEVDLIIEDGRRLLPIEFKWTSRPNRADARGLEEFLRAAGTQAPYGVVACGIPQPAPLTARVVAVPLGWLLS